MTQRDANLQGRPTPPHGKVKGTVSLSLLDPDKQKRQEAAETRKAAEERSQLWRAMRRFPFHIRKIFKRLAAGGR